MAKSADSARDAALKYQAKEKAKAKAAQAKADAKAANKAAAKPTTPISNVKAVSSMSGAERAQRNASESARVQGIASGKVTRRADNQPKGPTISIRSNPGISGKGGAMVGSMYRPMGGGGATNQYNK
jgi:membrane protein involved in colicin uptake